MYICYTYVLSLPVIFIVIGIIYISKGCLSEIELTCFEVKPFNSYLHNFILKKNDNTYDLYGDFVLNPRKRCIFKIDNLIDINNTKIQSYNNYHINKSYEIYTSKYHNNCFIDIDNKYRNNSYLGFSLMIFGDLMAGLLIYALLFQYYYDNKIGIETHENVEETKETSIETTIEITIMNQV